MKTILKSITIVICNFIILLLLSLYFDNLGSLIVGKFYGGFDIRDWWYEQVQCRIVNYLLATALMSGCIYLIYKSISAFVTDARRMVLGIVTGCVLIIILNIYYWKYIQTHCCGFEWSTLETAFSISYRSNESMCLFWSVYANLIFCMGILLNKIDTVILNQRIKTVWHQVLFSENTFCVLLYIGMPYCIFLSGTFFIVGVLEMTVINLFSLFVFVGILGYIIAKIIQFATINKYYMSIIKEPKKKEHLVIVQESPYVKRSFFVQHLFKTKIIRKMEKEGIWFYPNDMEIDVDMFIKLDIYDEWMFIRPESQRERIIRSISANRGTFNVAYISEDCLGCLKQYDGVFTEVGKLTDNIVRLTAYLNYKKNIYNELKQIDLRRLRKATCISDEISQFKRYLENQTDEFLVFDYAIKWLEIVNYMYALIAISKNKIQVSDNIQEAIEYADFKKWRKIFDGMLHTDQDLRSSAMSYVNDKTVFDVFDKLWTIVTSKKYVFVGYTVQEMLDAANKLRDYTRGHGVFTFGISQEINIRLVKILVFLINCLVEFLCSVDSLENLEELGWIIYSGDTPYYLYSVDKRFKEFKYESFQMGNSITLPLDIRG